MLLKLDPKERITAEDALHHPWITVNKNINFFLLLPK
jgi:serine/threonine protein kinase